MPRTYFHWRGFMGRRTRSYLVRGVMFLALLGSPAMAQTGAVFATDADAPISAQAAKMTLFKNGSRAELRGDARLEQGPLSLSASDVTMHYADTKNRATPQNDDRRLARIEALGNVHIVSVNGREVFGDKAVYQMETEMMTVSGNVRVVDTTDANAGDGLSGATLVINMRDGTSQVQSGETGGRARLKITPDTTP